MASGHASHQVGLDVDIWLTPMPNRTAVEQPNARTCCAVSVLKKNSLDGRSEATGRRSMRGHDHAAPPAIPRSSGSSSIPASRRRCASSSADRAPTMPGCASCAPIGAMTTISISALPARPARPSARSRRRPPLATAATRPGLVVHLRTLDAEEAETRRQAGRSRMWSRSPICRTACRGVVDAPAPADISLVDLFAGLRSGRRARQAPCRSPRCRRPCESRLPAIGPIPADKPN